MKIKSKKRYLFFINHPSKYHLYKNVINRLIYEKKVVDIIVFKKGVLIKLLKNENWNYYNIFPNGRKIKFITKKIDKIIVALFTLIKLFYFVLKNKKYHVFITSGLLVIPGFLFNIKTFFFCDNDYQTLSFVKMLFPFCKNIVAPISADMGRFNNKKISFKGNKSIAHLSPKYFKPNKNKVNCSSPYFIIRLSLLDAIHDDLQNEGINDRNLNYLVKYLSKYGIVLISSERKIPDNLIKFILQITPNDMAHYLSFAKLVVTDSGTMATEAAVLGTPNILINNLANKSGVHNELRDKFKLQYFYNKFEDSLEILNKIMIDKKLNQTWFKRKQVFHNYCDDLPEFLYKIFTKNYNK